jgi:hypothetical protein
VQTPAGAGTLATFETRSLSASLKKVSAGAPSVLNLLMFSTYCMYCIATALHCIALRYCIVLNFKLHVCNLIYPRPLLQ